jgi:hypothetical protein
MLPMADSLVLKADRIMMDIGAALHIAWHWLAAHGLAVMVAVYLGSTVCLIALALHAHGLAIRLARLTSESSRLSALVERLKQSDAARSQAIETFREQLAKTVHDPRDGVEIRTKPVPDELRNEIQSLIADIMAAEPGE